MNHITKLLNPRENILLEAEVSSRKRLFEEAAKVLSTAAGVPAQNVFDALIAREKLGSTGLGQLAAIPHARICGVVDPCLCLIRTSAPIDFGGPAQTSAQLFFIIAIPENSPEAYLDILSEIANLLQDPHARTALMKAETPGEIVTVITDWEPTTH